MNKGRTKETRGHTTRRPRRPATGRRIVNISRADTIRAEAGEQSRTEAAPQTEDEQKKTGGHRPGAGTLRPSRRHSTNFRAQTSNTGRTQENRHDEPRGNHGQRGRRWPRSTPKTSPKRDTKQRDEQRTNSEKEGGRGTPKGGLATFNGVLLKKTHGIEPPAALASISAFSISGKEEPNREGRRSRSGDEQATNRREAGPGAAFFVRRPGYSLPVPKR